MMLILFSTDVQLTFSRCWFARIVDIELFSHRIFHVWFLMHHSYRKIALVFDYLNYRVIFKAKLLLKWSKIKWNPFKICIIRLQSQMLSVTQPTEYGTVYTFNELKQLSKVVKQYHIYFRKLLLLLFLFINRKYFRTRNPVRYR